MKKRGLLLALLAALLAVTPVVAGNMVGERINLLGGFPTTFTAGDPFHIAHGNGGLDPKIDGPMGGYLFELEVDGEYIKASNRQTIVTLGEGQKPIQGRGWIFNFSDGLPAGDHTFVGHWFEPCKIAGGGCRTPNEPVEFWTETLVVTFN